mgnify:CR=1 FL=1
MSQILIPKEIEDLVNLVEERWGYYLGKRVIQSELFKATQKERTEIRAIGEKISKLLNEYLEKGVDTREEIKKLQEELATARATLMEKSAPFYEKLRPLNMAISYLDKKLIPEALEKATGRKPVPRLQVSEYLLKVVKK